VVALAAAKVKDENMKRQKEEYSRNILTLQSNLREKTTMVNNLQRDLENLNDEKLSQAATLGDLRIYMCIYII
jgi:predicted RNase H-like nuclease (RuvC/YqgF family)